MESILISIKKMLGITEEYKHFDPDIIMHINTVFDDLSQLGVVPYDDFHIEDELSVWTDYVPDAGMIESIKSYMYLRVKLLFDPPLNSSVIESMNRQIEKLEWRINTSAESTLKKKEDVFKLEEITVSENDTTVTPTNGYYGIGKVFVRIPTLDEICRPSTMEQMVIPPNGYLLSSVRIDPVTSGIDENIRPENIVKGVNILGVTGTEPGYDVGIEKGREEGALSFYNLFFDLYLRSDYFSYTFAGTCWKDELFAPNKDMKPVWIREIFTMNHIVDIVGCLKRVGHTLDTSKATYIYYIMRYNQNSKNLPFIDTSSCGDLRYFLYDNTKLKIIEGLRFKNDGTQIFDSAGSFGKMPELKEIKTIEGVIGQDVDFSGSPKLSKETYYRIFNALSTTSQGKTIVLSNNVDVTFYDDVNPGTYTSEWLALTKTRPNWSIAFK